jgi:drug/metabolite transporter (DMT)-like permease
VSRETVGLLLGFVGVVLFGGSLPFTRLALESLDPWFVTAARAALAFSPPLSCSSGAGSFRMGGCSRSSP